MAVKNYGIHDKWTDLDKLNNVDIKSVDGVIESIKINGEEAGGGGGSSDFSTAEVTFISSSGSYSVITPNIIEGELIVRQNNVTTKLALDANIPLYQGGILLSTDLFVDIDTQEMPVFTGSIEFVQGGILISGDGTITIKGV